MRVIRKHGFTLVEVIVVSVIVLVLAAVAIPVYTGYVEGTRKDAATNLAQTAAAAASSYYKKTGVDVNATSLSANTGALKLFYDSAKYTVGVSNSNIVVTYMLNGSSTRATVTVPYK
jgi:prepilin-type N-terminal cleavage/methylation domain-containing protein